MNKIRQIIVIFLICLTATGCAIKTPLSKTKDGAVDASSLHLTSGFEGSWNILSIKQRAVNPVTGEYDGEYSSRVLAVPQKAFAGELTLSLVAAGAQVGSALLLPGVRNRSTSNFAPNFNVSPNTYSGSTSGANLSNQFDSGSNIILD